ncbi:MAG TPA: sigma-54 dependent transcriptional regulator [bacterium]
MPARILVVDDEEVVCRAVARILDGKGHQIETVTNGVEGLRRVEATAYDLVILDIMMPEVSGLDILQRVKESQPDTDVIMITGLSQIETAVQSMKLGAFDYIPKPFTPEELSISVERSLERRRLLRENTLLRAEAGSKYRFENIIGSSPQMQNVYRLIAKCAPTNSTVFISGESGTGKELIARAIHYNSLRKDRPFVPVDCGSLSETLLESELFGHVKGAFTGAVANKQGLFKVADGGTLFLDEIGNISLATQAKLLRVLQEHEFKPVGDTRSQPSNIRLITATNLDLKALVGHGKFREDLLYRINVFPIVLPPLRDRREDIPALAYHFLKTFSDELGKRVREISPEALNLLLNHDWPGNIRELENTIHRAVILTNDHVISQAHLSSILELVPRLEANVPTSAEELKRVKKTIREKSVERIEKLFVLEALRRNGWSVTRSAEETGMQRTNFQALMKKYGIRVRGAAGAVQEPDDAGAEDAGEDDAED